MTEDDDAPRAAGFVEGPVAWMQDGACLSADPEAFFPDKGCSYEAALRICERCTVRRDCLHYALDRGIDDGLFGGMTPAMRSRLTRRTG